VNTRPIASLLALVLAPFLAISSKPAIGQPAVRNPVSSPWKKLCPGGDLGCVTGISGRTEAGQQLFSTLLTEPADGAQKTLSFVLPPSPLGTSDLRLSIDAGQPLVKPSVSCASDGCTVDFAASDALIDQMKSGRLLTMESIDKEGRATRYVVPLAGFASAHDGPTSGSTPEPK
jgi:invasion protein IalB